MAGKTMKIFLDRRTVRPVRRTEPVSKGGQSSHEAASKSGVVAENECLILDRAFQDSGVPSFLLSPAEKVSLHPPR